MSHFTTPGGPYSMKLRHPIAASIALLLAAAQGQAADSNAGKQVFRQQCALCHSAEPNDGGGAQGPNLSGVFDRPAATGSDFSYTPALKNSKLTWDAGSLDKFLASPTTVVPGSAMVIPIPDAKDRENVIAYFSDLKAGTFKDAQRPGGFGPPPGGPRVAKAPEGEAEWKTDAPGKMHRVDLSKLPEPLKDFSEAATNFPRVVPKPEGAKLSVPPGFKVETFASEGLQGPREMQVAPNGDIFLVETNPGRITVLRMGADGKLAGRDVFAQGLLQPYGFQFYPAKDPKWLYVAETNRVVRYKYASGDRKASAVPEVVVAKLSPVGGGHFTRDLQFSRDGKTMYVSVGSQSNVPDAKDMPRKSAAEAAAWEKTHGLGAAWGTEENRAAVLSYDMANLGAGPKTYASGIRNCVSLTLQPNTDQLWCTTNERDLLGDNLVPDYSTRIKRGQFFGWPWYYMGDHEDPRLAGDRPDLKGKITKPDVPYTSHSAAVNLDFYQPSNGASAFPAEYNGEGLAVLHGSWNRGHRTGGKIVRVKMKKGVPTGEYQDFLTGFIIDDGSVWGRPVALAQMRDGSLLLADDGNNTIFRISYSK